MTDATDHDDEELELDHLLQKVRPIKDEAGDLRKVHEAVDADQENRLEDDLTVAGLVFDKWRVVHKYIHARPFRLPEGLKRSHEWLQVAQTYGVLKEPELSQWIELQVEVARNIEEGRSDQRIRRDGPCYLIVLEYVGNKKRTALAVLHWAKEQASKNT
jgi:hypothetical protein